MFSEMVMGILGLTLYKPTCGVIRILTTMVRTFRQTLACGWTAWETNHAV